MYSVDQLNDALENIDKERFPDRVETIKKYLKKPGPRGHRTKDNRIAVSDTANKVFTYISMELIFWLIVIALGLLGFSLW